MPTYFLQLVARTTRTGLLVLGLASCCLAAISLRAEVKILFIGNSYTHGLGGTASVPDIFDALARAGGQEDPLVAMRAVSGQDFKYHYENSLSYISQEPWTHVVLQNYSTEPTHIGDLAEHFTYGSLLYDAVMANNPDTQVHLYLTWARAYEHPYFTDGTFDSPDQMLDELRTNYRALADQLNARNPYGRTVVVNPVGEAWMNVGGNLPLGSSGAIDLFYTDNYHGNDSGYYLSACVHYACIYQASPVGLFTRSEVQALGLDVTAGDAARLEQAAWDTVSSQTSQPALLYAVHPAPGEVALVFSDAIEAALVADTASYTVANQGRLLPISAATLASNSRTVTLSVEGGLSGNYVIDYSALGSEYGSGLLIGNAGDVYDIFIDFSTNTSVSTGSVTWNGVSISDSIRNAVGNGTGTPHLLASDLLSAFGSATGISLAMTDAMGGNNTNGTSTGPFPGAAISDSFYGQTGDNLGFTDNGLGLFEFRGLDPTKHYSFTFFASRMGVSDNRDTVYALTGTTTQSATLNAASNTDQVAIVRDVMPDSSGTITLEVSAGSSNTSSKLYYYLGAVKISVSKTTGAPHLYPPVYIGCMILVDWTGVGSLEQCDDLGDTWTVSPTYCAPWQDTCDNVFRRFYRLSY